MRMESRQSLIRIQSCFEGIVLSKNYYLNQSPQFTQTNIGIIYE